MKRIIIVLVLATSAFSLSFIMKLFSLKEILDQSTNVLVGRIERIDADGKTAVATIDRAIKGKREFARVQMNLGVAAPEQYRYLLAKMREGEPVIIFYQRKDRNLAACVHAGDTWFQLFAQDQGEGDKLWWRMSHLEVYLGRTYNGTTADFIPLVEGVIKGTVKSPPPDPKVPQLDPKAALASLSRTAKPAPERKPEPERTPERPTPAPAPAAEGLEALEGWAVDAGWSRPGALTIADDKARGKVMRVVAGGETRKKLALVLLRHVDLTGVSRVSLDVAHDAADEVKVSMAFGAAPDWQMYESPAAAVARSDEPQTVTFRLDRADFKSEATAWKHAARLPNGGSVDKLMIVVEGLSEKGSVRLDNLRLSRGGFRVAARYPHKGGEVRGIAWADVNGDEMVDALVSVQHGNLLLVNQGGTFRDMAGEFGLSGGSRAASWADCNGDGHPDLLLNDFRLYLHTGGRLKHATDLLKPPKGYNPEGAGWIDANGDGLPDILITNGEHGIYLYENIGARFEDVSARVGLGAKGLGVGNGDFILMSDLDGDGFTDFCYNFGKGVLALNDGEGKFRQDTRSGLTSGAGDKRGLVAADFDRDGDVDVFVPGERPQLYRSNGDGTFTDVLADAGDLSREGDASFSAAWGDVNCDGALDLFVCHPKAPSRIYLGNGKGKFTDATDIVAPGGFPACFAASFADVDGDGDLDLLMNTADAAVLAVNEMDLPEGACALVVDIQAKKGATGAVIRVLDDAGRIAGLRELTGAESCGGQASPYAHFGLRKGSAHTVTAGLSDGRLATRRITLNDHATRLIFADADFRHSTSSRP